MRVDFPAPLGPMNPKNAPSSTESEILGMLKSGRMSAGDIVAHFEVTGASISRHLSVLKDADLIRDSREGKFIFYELNTSVLEDIMLWITNLKEDKKND